MLNIDRSLRLPAGQFIDERWTKDLIVIHHTVGGSAKSTFDYWLTQPERIGTAFIIERDGTIYETFDPSRWAYHLGLKGAAAAGGRHEKRSIGIELASEGALTEKDGRFYAFDGKREVPVSQVYDVGYPWRDRRYFDIYDAPQLASCFELVAFLLDAFKIPRQTVRNHRIGTGSSDGIDRLAFRGILGHADLRWDKTDPHPGFPWDDLARRCGLTVLPAGV